jgi:hypothetical protein
MTTYLDQFFIAVSGNRNLPSGRLLAAAADFGSRHA